ncbi:YitT family protein [Apilactobacillus apisilvae]|uniref:YitT family protein n=1 Tax=Apilactobacillus apisilvae TaxID=2923364 RepID=A0ABY4PG28_9LACO|nr:YitT family protein [Apilactobacillus apisilvae]UQS84474.1 YitT family protein [Apilactobacillus apisilvae]
MENVPYDDSKNTNKKPLDIFLRSIVSLAGITILSMGAAFLLKGNVGLDPFTAMNTGIAAKLGMSLGVLQLIVNFLLFLLVFIFDRKQIGIGTIFNMVLVGYEIDFFAKIYSNIFPNTVNIPMMIVDAIVGIALFTLGTSLYMNTKLGVSPYDAIAPIISDRTHTKYQTVRSLQDIIVMILALVFSGPFGVVTLFTAFLAGSLINFWNNTVSRSLMVHVDHFSRHPTMKNASNGFLELGKNGYNIVLAAYQNTYTMQKNMSGYSNAKLEELINRSQDNIRKNEQVNVILNQRLDSLKEELRERNAKNINK